ncbi:hypothetical protein C8J55DRAFT_562006 [Lentinula edodes]|uniref:Uncharacterized protein n=1 Tax=Lentinula lateritia TaxID=40482 RepID=A0A9W9DL38_9AGAR|nr:hypothetical protein C8J55DRAFT_562006 [Lentinula edodes]
MSTPAQTTSADELMTQLIEQVANLATAMEEHSSSKSSMNKPEFLATRVGNHGDKEGDFDSTRIMMKKWAEFECERRWKSGTQLRDPNSCEKANSNCYSLVTDSDTFHQYDRNGIFCPQFDQQHSTNYDAPPSNISPPSRYSSPVARSMESPQPRNSLRSPTLQQRIQSIQLISL